MHSAILGVVFCLDFSPFFFSSSLVPLPGVFPLFISRMKFHQSAISFNGKNRRFLEFLVTKFRDFLFNFFPDFCIKFQ